MPIQKFSNSSKEKSIDVTNKNTVRLLSVVFSKGFENSEWLEFNLSFTKSKQVYKLQFKNVVRDPKQSGLFFYRGNGAVFPIPDNAMEMKIKAVELKNMDFEFVLTYDFYPGSI
jgi:hypothetical protein